MNREKLIERLTMLINLDSDQKVTESQVENWVGSDTSNETISDDYMFDPPLVTDVLDLWESR